MKPKKIKLNKFNDKRGYLLELLPKRFKNSAKDYGYSKDDALIFKIGELKKLKEIIN